MKTYNSELRFIFTLILVASISFLSNGQESKPFILGKRADILNEVIPSSFFKIPELHSVNGELKVDLYINEQTYIFVGDTVKLRTYTYESGEFHSTDIGPWGPTLRIGSNDRLSITIHNNLPEIDDQVFLGIMDESMSKYLKKFDHIKKKEITDELKTAMINAVIKNTTLLDYGNLDGAYGEIVIPNKRWIVHGRVPCPCGPGKKTCTKVYIDYNLELKYNVATGKNDIRISELMKHDEVDHNVPHGFSRTNFHTHGFHISPSQDDIFRTVEPSYSSYYTYDLDDHTPGTMWYHPHVHGSTALQVASGMSGAIIIEDEFDDEDKNEDFAALATASESEHERTLIFNQIVYDTTIGELTDFDMLRAANTPKGTTINGISVPKMIIAPGEIQRWRMIHSGYSSTMALLFPKEAIVYQIAIDGIMFDKPVRIESLHLAPGNRSDILIQIPKEVEAFQLNVLSANYKGKCEYFRTDPECLFSDFGLDSLAQLETMLTINVAGEKQTMNFPETLPGPVGHETIDSTELINSGEYRLTDFFIDTEPDVSKYLINKKPFDSQIISETLVLGTAEQWKITSSNNFGHPYHIHINPFQVVSYGDSILDTPIWKDVIMVEGSDTEAIIYARYVRYVGDFVIHCHILMHEDQGMMQRVRIVRPDDYMKTSFQLNANHSKGLKKD
jgi:FtsP/CotA-like multicopper oxidase with cupredoxin domain